MARKGFCPPYTAFRGTCVWGGRGYCNSCGRHSQSVPWMPTACFIFPGCFSSDFLSKFTGVPAVSLGIITTCFRESPQRASSFSATKFWVGSPGKHITFQQWLPLVFGVACAVFLVVESLKRRLGTRRRQHSPSLKSLQKWKCVQGKKKVGGLRSLLRKSHLLAGWLLKKWQGWIHSRDKIS